MVIHKIKILKDGKWCVHPALGPIIELKKEQVIDIHDSHDIYTKNLSNDLVDCGRAEIIKEEEIKIDKEEPKEESKEKEEAKVIPKNKKTKKGK